MPRQLLMIEVNSATVLEAARRIVDALPDAQVWGNVDPVDAALLVIDQQLPAVAAYGT
jgi:hypothetical protein